MNGRTDVLANIRRSLGVTGQEATRQAEVQQRLEATPRGIIPARGQLEPAARLRLFTDMLEMAQASFSLVAESAGVPAAISEYLRHQNLPQRIRMGRDQRLVALPWDDTPLEVLAGPATGDDIVGVSHADAGIAETGTLLLTSGDGNPTTVNFLPETHIVLVSCSDITGDYESAWDRLRQRFGRGVMPRVVNWITGPSRSADIEQTLLLGAHGPRQLHVILVGTP